MTVALLFALALQGKDRVPQEPLRQAELRVFDQQTNELLCELKAREATPGAGGSISIVDPLATLYTRDSERVLHKFEVRAARATYDPTTQRLKAEGKVRITSPEGVSFAADAALVDLKKQRVETEDAFRLAKPGVEILGTGLAGRLDMSEGRIVRDGQITIFGDPREALSRDPTPDPAPGRTILRGVGPMRFQEEGKKLSVSISKGVNVLREDSNGILTAKGGSAELEGARDASGAIRIDRLDLSGGIEMADSRDGRAEGDRLSLAGDVVRVSAARGCAVAFGSNEIFAKEIAVDRVRGWVEARGNPRARTEAGAEISAREIDLTLAPVEKRWEIRTLQARGSVEARREGVRIVAPLVAIRGRSTMFVSGPKLLRFDADGKTHTATCRGDARIAQDALDLEGDAFLSGPDVRMSADRILAARGEDGKLKWVLGRGAVRLTSRTKDGETAAAFGREVRAVGSAIQIRAEPEAMLVTKDRRVWAAEILLDRETGRFSARGGDRPARMRVLSAPR